MNPFWTQLIIQTVLKKKGANLSSKKTYSDYRVAKAYR